jgi:hypothetical protein
MYIPKDNRGRLDVSLLETLITRITKNSEGCWEWSGTNGLGYGYVTYQGSYRVVHRLLYELSTGNSTKGFDLHHICVNRKCVNPRHVTPLTRSEHKKLHAQAKQNGACKNGHEFTEANTYQLGNHRTCKECKRKYNREYKARQRAKLTY